MDKTYLLFDLDGTLTDSKIGITKSIQYSLQFFGIHVDLDDLVAFVGPPLRDSFRTRYGFTPAETERAVEKFNEYYSETGIFENALYSGIDALLKEQFERGKTLVLATSKPTIPAKRILKHFEIEPYFSFVAGSEPDGSRSRKDLVIRYALDSMGITSPRPCVMIGDKEHDVIGAKKVGMDSVGVLYGYGSLDELVNAGATYIAESVDDLSNLLI